MISFIGYQIGEGFKNVLKNKKSTASSLAIMCMVMLVFGAFFAISENINYIMNNVEDAQAMQAFIDEDATEEQIKTVGEKIKKINGVNTIEFVSKEEAYNTYIKRFEGKDKGVNLAEGFDETAFPTSYIVTLTDLSLSTEVKQEIKDIDLITDILSSDVTLETLMNLTKGIRLGTAVLLLILIFVSIFIISNTIKLTVYSRRKEISIMKYVGATNSFIRWPFIIEGIIIGILSGVISILIVGLGYNAILNQIIQTEVVKRVGIAFVNFSDMFNLIVIVYLILGSGIGIIGSSMSMRKYLDV